MRDWKTVAVAPGIAIYFCDPQPMATRHEREHQRLAAPVLHQGHDLSVFTDDDLDSVAAELTDSLRKWSRGCVSRRLGPAVQRLHLAR